MVEERKDSITKKQLRDIAFTKQWLEENFKDEKGQKINADYIENLFKVLYVEKRRVTGLTQRDKKGIALTASHIKDYTAKAIKDYEEQKTPETKEIADKWKLCYKNYIAYFVNRALEDKKNQPDAEQSL